MGLGPECGGDRSLPGGSCLCRGHTYLENMAELGSVRYQLTLEPDSGRGASPARHDPSGLCKAVSIATPCAMPQLWELGPQGVPFSPTAICNQNDCPGTQCSQIPWGRGVRYVTVGVE